MSKGFARRGGDRRQFRIILGIFVVVFAIVLIIFVALVVNIVFLILILVLGDFQCTLNSRLLLPLKYR